MSNEEATCLAQAPTDTTNSTALMDWKEWERWMNKLQRRGLSSFLARYVATKRLEVEKFLTNLDLTISISVNEDTEDTESLQRLQALISIKRSLIKFLKTRKKLSNYNTIEDLVQLISTSSKILILTGAGISTSCGIPDFRSQNGLYSQLKDFEELDDVYDMFDLKFFKSNPQPFYKFSKKIFPFSSSSILTTAPIITPSDSHKFLKLVESKSKLLRNYTQNIDTLEMRAGVTNLIQCHGSFATFTCLKCGAKFPSAQFEREVADGQVPLCTLCGAPDAQPRPLPQPKRRKTNAGKSISDNGWGSSDGEDTDEEVDWVSQGLVKPDIIFFGENLPREFDDAIDADRTQCDLVIVIGTSLAVAPVSEILDCIPAGVPQVLINRDPIGHAVFDICLLGEADPVVRELCRRLGDGWELGARDQHPPREPEQVGASHVWLFEGANRDHPWLSQWRPHRSDEADPPKSPSGSEQSECSDSHHSSGHEDLPKPLVSAESPIQDGAEKEAMNSYNSAAQEGPPKLPVSAESSFEIGVENEPKNSLQSSGQEDLPKPLMSVKSSLESGVKNDSNESHQCSRQEDPQSLSEA